MRPGQDKHVIQRLTVGVQEGNKVFRGAYLLLGPQVRIIVSGAACSVAAAPLP